MVPMLSLVFDSHMTKHEAHVGSHVAAKQGDTRDTATVALQLFLTSLSFRARGGGQRKTCASTSQVCVFQAQSETSRSP